MAEKTKWEDKSPEDRDRLAEKMRSLENIEKAHSNTLATIEGLEAKSRDQRGRIRDLVDYISSEMDREDFYEELGHYPED